MIVNAHRRTIRQIVGIALLLLGLVTSGIIVPSRIDQAAMVETGKIVFSPVFSPLLFAIFCAVGLNLLEIVRKDIDAWSWLIGGISGVMIWLLSETPFGFEVYHRNQWNITSLTEVITILSLIMSMTSFVEKKLRFHLKNLLTVEGALLLSQFGALFVGLIVTLDGGLSTQNMGVVLTMKIIARVVLVLGGLSIIPLINYSMTNRIMGLICCISGTIMYILCLAYFFNIGETVIMKYSSAFHPYFFYMIKEYMNLPLFGSVVVIGISMLLGNGRFRIKERGE